MSKNVIVVGMPRSGTSMTTAIFVRCGYFVAQNEKASLRDGDEFNSEGYFEASDLIERNVRVLNRAGYAHHNTWKFEPIDDDQVDRIASLERQESDAEFVELFEANSPWVWKDPRLCYTLEYWWQYLEGTDTVVLLLHRSHRDIHVSFQRIGWRDASDESRRDVKRRTAHHIAAAKQAIERFDIPCVEIQYKDFKNNPKRVLATINEITGLQLSYDDLGFRPEFDHSSGRGAVERKMESLALSLPQPLVRAMKRLAPRKMLKAFFPSRFG